MGDVFPKFRPFGPCECGDPKCLLEGTLQKNRHVRMCPCRSCLGRRNRRKGARKQAKAATALGVPRSSLRPGHEEHMPGTIRFECKSGAQVGPIWTRYTSAERQSEASRPIGDHRPFVFVAMADGTKDGLAIVRLSDLHEFVAAYVEQFGNA